MLGREDVGRSIWKVFTKTNGLTLQVEASEYLKQYLGELEATAGGPVDVPAELNRLANAYRQQSCTAAIPSWTLTAHSPPDASRPELAGLGD